MGETVEVPSLVLEVLSASPNDAVLALDRDGTIAWVSPSCAPMLGWQPEDLEGRTGIELIHPEELGRAGAVLAASAQGFSPRATARYRVQAADGSYQECDLSVAGLGDPSDPKGFAIWIRLANDQLILHEMVQGLLEGSPTEDILSVLLELIFSRTEVSRGTVTLRDAADELVAVGNALPDTLNGLDLQDDSVWAKAQRDGEDLLFETGDALPEPLRTTAAAHGLSGLWIIPIRASDGEWYATITIWMIEGGPSPTLNAYAVELLRQLVELVLQWRSHVTALENAAIRDGLTGLFNRRGLDAQLAAPRDTPLKAGDTSATGTTGILYLDLDHFKSINDQHGHLVGDTVLVAAAKRIQAAVRPNDLVARFGGDEFVVLCRDVDAEALHHIAERIHVRVTRPMQIDGQEIHVGVSVGVALGDPDEPRLLELADEALYCAKAAGRNQIHWTDPSPARAS